MRQRSNPTVGGLVSGLIPRCSSLGCCSSSKRHCLDKSYLCLVEGSWCSVSPCTPRGQAPKSWQGFTRISIGIGGCCFFLDACRRPFLQICTQLGSRKRCGGDRHGALIYLLGVGSRARRWQSLMDQIRE